MRIGIASDSVYPYTCGVSVAINEVIAALKEFDLILIAPEHPGAEYYKNIRMIRLPSIGLGRGYRVVAYFSRRNLKKIIGSLRSLDVLILESVTLLTVLLTLIIRIYRIRVKVVLHLHTEYDKYSEAMLCGWKKIFVPLIIPFVRWLVRQMAGWADTVLCPSENFQSILQSRFKICKDIIVWPAPVGLPEPSIGQIDISALFGKSIEDLEDALILLLCGRVAAEKNLEHMFKVFSEVHALNNNAYLVIVGGGELELYKRICKQLCSQAAANVVFTDRLERDQMAELYLLLKKIGTVIGVSSVQNETQGLGFLEILNFGFPVCVLRGTPMAKVVVSSDGGCVLSLCTQEWIDRLIFLANPKTQKIKELMGRNGQRYISEHFSKEILYKKLRKIILTE